MENESMTEKNNRKMTVSRLILGWFCVCIGVSLFLSFFLHRVSPDSSLCVVIVKNSDSCEKIIAFLEQAQNQYTEKGTWHVLSSSEQFQCLLDTVVDRNLIVYQTTPSLPRISYLKYFVQNKYAVGTEFQLLLLCNNSFFDGLGTSHWKIELLSYFATHAVRIPEFKLLGDCDIIDLFANLLLPFNEKFAFWVNHHWLHLPRDFFISCLSFYPLAPKSFGFVYLSYTPQFGLSNQILALKNALAFSEIFTCKILFASDDLITKVFSFSSINVVEIRKKDSKLKEIVLCIEWVVNEAYFSELNYVADKNIDCARKIVLPQRLYTSKEILRLFQLLGVEGFDRIHFNTMFYVFRADDANEIADFHSQFLVPKEEHFALAQNFLEKHQTSNMLTLAVHMRSGDFASFCEWKELHSKLFLQQLRDLRKNRSIVYQIPLHISLPFNLRSCLWNPRFILNSLQLHLEAVTGPTSILLLFSTNADSTLWKELEILLLLFKHSLHNSRNIDLKWLRLGEYLGEPVELVPLIDQYVCTLADKFIGNKYSTFSARIAEERQKLKKHSIFL